MQDLLATTKKKYEELALAQEVFDKQRLHSDKVIEAANRSLEDEIAFRKGIEMKLSEMHN